MFPSRMIRIGFDDLFQEFDLINGGLSVVRSGSDDLQGHVFPRSIVPREPDCREVTPAKFANHGILPILVLLPNMYRMIAALAVIFRILFIGRVWWVVFVIRR